jgi:prevent-host-death family protein
MRAKFGAHDVHIVTIHAAKTNLSKLLARVEAGEEIVSTRGKSPIARLTRIRPRPAARHFGAMKGIVHVGPEFFEPMTEAELKERE